MRYVTYILVTCVVALLTLGTVMLCSAPAGFIHFNFEKQLAFCVVGASACVLAARGDYGCLRKISWWVYAAAVLALLAVLIVGVSRGGARRWFNLSFMLVQPSEPAKLALVLALAHYIEWKQRQMDRWLEGLVYPLLLSGAVMGLVLFEPDFGTTILLGGVVGALLLLAGVPWRRLGLAALVGVLAISALIAVDPVRRARMLSYFHGDQLAPELKEVNYHSDQCKIAIGSGGLFGFGLGEGLMKMGSVPENHTDSIFSIVGEELGLAMTVPVVLAYAVVFLCGLYISCHARDPFGVFLGFGITFLLGMQAFINIGVVTGLLPNKGLALPFMSYGGSSLVVMLTSVGLLLNIARHHAEPEPAFAEALSFDDLPSTQAT